MNKQQAIKNIQILFFGLYLTCNLAEAQYIDAKDDKVNASTKLYLSRPNYETPYGETHKDSVKALLDKVFKHIDTSTPIGVMDKTTGKPITNYKKINENSIINQGVFSMTNYMWGVTYSSLLSATRNTGDDRYKKYVKEHLQFLSEVGPYFQKVLPADDKIADPQMRQVLRPKALDDAGAMCSSMIEAKIDKVEFDGKEMMDRYFDFIYNKEYRLEDGTFARNRPQRNTLWLDDMFMGVPAVANMGTLTGDTKYYDEAIKQIVQFADRMFMPENGLYRHGWVEAMDPHPAFHWGRANGWALLTKVEVLDAIPEGYPGREKVLALLQQHIEGLSSLQSSKGLWHQLLDRNDSYLETSATAIYVYCMAKAINEGWINGLSYGPQVMLGWHGLTTKVTSEGKIEGTCVGTGMGFDPAFYYYRPVSTAAAHGYGAFIFAAAEVYRLLEKQNIKLNDSGLHFYDEKIETNAPIFYLEKDGVRDHH